MLCKKDDCVFFSNGYCIHTDGECSKICRWAMKKYPIDMGSHLATYWRRREWLIDLWTRWFAVVVSVIALVVSVLTYIDKRTSVTQPSNAIALFDTNHLMCNTCHIVDNPK